MTVASYHGVGSRKVEFRIRYFQTVLRSFADQPELGCVPVVVRLETKKRRLIRETLGEADNK